MPNSMRWRGKRAPPADAFDESEALRRSEKRRQDHAWALRAESEREEKALFEERARRATLLSGAIDAFNAEDFERAVTKAEQVLREEADNEVAQDIVVNARRARRRTMSEHYLRDLKDSFRRWQVDIERTKVPQAGILRWPSQSFWDKITRLRTSQGVAAGGRTLTDEEQGVMRALRSRDRRSSV